MLKFPFLSALISNVSSILKLNSSITSSAMWPPCKPSFICTICSPSNFTMSRDYWMIHMTDDSLYCTNYRSLHSCQFSVQFIIVFKWIYEIILVRTNHYSDNHSTNHYSDNHSTNHYSDNHSTNHYSDNHSTNHYSDNHSTNHYSDNHSTNHYSDNHSTNQLIIMAVYYIVCRLWL